MSLRYPKTVFIYFYLFLFFFLIYDSHREREREREAETQAEEEAGSMHREPDVGFDPGSPGSRPGPKAGAKPLRHPGIPGIIFYRVHPVPWTVPVTSTSGVMVNALLFVFWPVLLPFFEIRKQKETRWISKQSYY